MIFQWGIEFPVINGYQEVIFPKAFPHKCLLVTSSAMTKDHKVYSEFSVRSVDYYSITATSFQIANINFDVINSWFAIGY